MSSLVLPDDIIVDILSRLPVKSLLRLRCVCKPWLKLLSDTSFVKMHLNHGIQNEKFRIVAIGYHSSSRYNSIHYYDSSLTCYEFGYKSPFHDGFKIAGSCKGLVCLVARLHDFIYIWNPSTKEYKEILGPPVDGFHNHRGCKKYSFLTYGFGYNCSIDDYKFVRLYISDDDSPRSIVEVYTLGSNSWKTIPFLYPYRPNNQVGALVNGALHWIAHSLIEESRGYEEVIVSFDIEDERSTVLCPVVQIDDDYPCMSQLCAIGEHLCLFNHRYRVSIEVWAMKDYGVRDSWTKLFTVAEQSFMPSQNSFYFVKNMQSFENGEILSFVQSRKFNNFLVLYDPKHESVRTLTVQCGGIFESDATVYVESLVSLNTGTYVGEEIVEERLVNEEDNDEKEEECWYEEDDDEKEEDRYEEDDDEKEEERWYEEYYDKFVSEKKMTMRKKKNIGKKKKMMRKKKNRMHKAMLASHDC